MSRITLVPADHVPEGGSMIRVENLTKKFGDFVALDDVSFDVKKGEIFGLLGPNGAGKSTTLRILSTLARPTRGTASIGGYDIVKDDTDVRKLIGIVSEKMIMYDRLTARENLRFFGSLFEIPSDVLTQRIDELLDLVQLTKWKNALVGTFSTGMRQRMNVVRALLNMPRVPFLDEPTLGLDPQSSVEIREFVKKLNRENGTTIIVTTHTMVDADMLCDQRNSHPADWVENVRSPSSFGGSRAEPGLKSDFVSWKASDISKRRDRSHNEVHDGCTHRERKRISQEERARLRDGPPENARG